MKPFNTHHGSHLLAFKATFLVSDARAALRERTQTTLRHILGSRELQDCIENREAIATEIKEVIDGPAHEWGIKVESILIKDINFGPQLQESLASAATQKRIGEAKVILARVRLFSIPLYSPLK
jgi:regulator of protease activity HflC (stomatin/prohibitin superfamily)